MLTPIAFSTAYKRLSEAVRVVECSYIGSEFPQRVVYTQDLKHSSAAEVESLGFFGLIVNRVHVIGLGSLAHAQHGASIGLKQLYQWIKREMNIPIPARFRDTAEFHEFVEERLIGLRSAAVAGVTMFDEGSDNAGEEGTGGLTMNELR